jgi:hypothetical protein
MFKNFFYIIIVILIIPSCNTFDSVKRGLTGEKSNSADEFLVQKKDALVLPPDFENLPTPTEVTNTEEESIFEQTISEQITENESESTSVEESILKKIQSK